MGRQENIKTETRDKGNKQKINKLAYLSPTLSIITFHENDIKTLRI